MFSIETHPIGTKVIIDMSQYGVEHLMCGEIVGYTPTGKVKVKYNVTSEKAELFSANGIRRINDYHHHYIEIFNDYRWSVWKTVVKQKKIANFLKNEFKWHELSFEKLTEVMNIIKSSKEVPNA